ncbi:Zinc finger protein ZAT5 [Bienertia sinuspersici]
MVAQQEAIVGENSVVVVAHQEKYHNQLHTINKNMMMIKGKRTKRQRPLSPLALTMSSSTTTADEGGSAASEDWTAPNSIATSPEEEEEQGTNNKSNSNNNNNNDSSTNLNIIKGSNVISSCYECKTCNKTFSSFQALGGHRASHKKPKINNIAALSELKKSSPVIFSLLNHHHHHDDGTTLSLQMANSTLCTTNNNNNANNTPSKTKVHECGICGAEFSSGQALGGHMRRHRPIGTTTSTLSNPSENSALITAIPTSNIKNVKDEKTTRNLLSLDLNLPAPEDEHHHQQQRDSSSKFVFSSNEKTLVFAASSSQLVDCHY